MKYCPTCGSQMDDAAAFCTNCSTALSTPAPKKESGITIAAKVLMVLGAIITSIAAFPVIGLAWCIPMTVVYFKNVKNNRPISTAFKICTLLFVSLPAGILMLCDSSH